MRNDWYAAHRLAEQQDENRPKVPDFTTYHSLVFDGVDAALPIPTYWAPFLSFAQVQFINLLQLANAQGREVMLIIRGVSGPSVAPSTDARIHKRWPNLVVRISYALRPNFVDNDDCVIKMLQPHRLPVPFSLRVTPRTARNIYHSRLINIKDLEDQFNGFLQSSEIGQVLE